MKIMRLMLGLSFISVSLMAESLNVYKYKDEKGRWVFSDTKPQQTEFEKLEVETPEDNTIRPKLYIQKTDNGRSIVALNPFHAPVEVYVAFKSGRDPLKKVLLPLEKTRVTEVSDSESFRYKWVLGDPNSRAKNQTYRFPVGTPGTYRISQGFNGAFSHFREPNTHAVDIAMQIGTDLVAAREGTVIFVKDDYHMGGRGQYFLDKANQIKVLHDDGTYATYAHTLLGSAVVKPGDKVVLGQVLAKSGSSGYSTGPHLHFVVRQNVGLKTKSVRFTLKDQNGGRVNIVRNVRVQITP